METKPTRKRRRRPRLGGSVSEASVWRPWVILPPVEVAVVEMASMVAEREKIWWMNVCWLRRREEWRRPRTRQSRAQSRAATTWTWMTPALATLLTRGPRGAQAPGQKALLVCVCKCAGLVCGCLFFNNALCHTPHSSLFRHIILCLSTSSLTPLTPRTRSKCPSITPQYPGSTRAP